MRLVGALLICGACVALGARASLNLSRRPAALLEFVKCVDFICGKISLEKTELVWIFAEAEKMQLNHFDGFFKSCNGKCKALGAQKAWRDSAKYLPSYLSACDSEMILAFGSQLGRGDFESQLKLCRQTREQCDKLICGAQEKKEKLSSLYISLGALGGTALAILLM